MSSNHLYHLKYLTIALIFCKFIGFVQSSIDSFQFDVNDILNEKFMPAHLLAQELETFFKGSSNSTREHFYKPDETETTSCNFTTAFSTMGFHRKMMNEYLATNFLAKQILNEFPLDADVPPIERRIGAPSSSSANSTEEVDSSVKSNHHRQGKYIQNEMLEDPGSASYRSWLDKTTMLDDIQRQFTDNAQNQIADFKPLQQGSSPIKKTIDSEDEGLEEEDFDEGDITGYAYTGGVTMDSAPNYPNALPPPRHHLPFDATNSIHHLQPAIPTAGSKNGYYPPSGQENSYETYGQTHHVQPAPPPQQSIKEIGLKDILDIALTTLAFLSFGMFILQVLMCITMNKEDTSSMMMMPMEGTDTGTMQPTNEGATEEIRRRKRNLPENQRIQMMNDLSRRVLHSIDAVLMMPHDNGRCQYRSLCEINKFAREQKNGQKVWIPMWSLGISWFSSRMKNPNTTTGNPILESLKASVVGLGNGDCKNIYPSCQMEIPADEKRKMKIERKRKKRDLSDRLVWKIKKSKILSGIL